MARSYAASAGERLGFMLDTTGNGSASGILLVDKPASMTSHDVVARVRRIIGTRKVGHAGTLDPMATGLLVLGVNSSTRLLTWIVGLDKEYLATIRLGASSSTDDAEGQLSARASAKQLDTITDPAITKAIAGLSGHILQRPSSVSAIKVNGKRAYTLAREGADVVLPTREVSVTTFEILATRRPSYQGLTSWIELDVRIECSSGTYIRALARDLGVALAAGGHLSALRRTRIGPFATDSASTLTGSLAESLLPPSSVATLLFDRVDLSIDQAIDLAHGRRVPLAHASLGPIAAIAPDGRLVGLVKSVNGALHVLANFPPDETPT